MSQLQYFLFRNFIIIIILKIGKTGKQEEIREEKGKKGIRTKRKDHLPLQKTVTIRIKTKR